MFYSSIILTLQVPLGILLKNENKSDEMAEILAHLHQYIPTKPCTDKVVLNQGKVIQVPPDRAYPTIVGGDQLTAARTMAAIKNKSNSQHPVQRLDGIIPAVEDWHAKGNFFGVS